jgi:chromate transporter
LNFYVTVVTLRDIVHLTYGDKVKTKLAQEGTEVKPVGFWEAFWFWVKLGFINFGGPAGQIAIMHKELVEKKRWVSEQQYLRTLNFCMLLPGPEAQQVATYIGWRLHGTVGGIVAGSFFVIPSIFVLWLLSYLAVAHADVPAITGLLYGIQASAPSTTGCSSASRC